MRIRVYRKFKRSFANDHLLLVYLFATPVELMPTGGGEPPPEA